MKILVDANIYLTSMHYAGIKRKLMWLIIEAGDTLVITDTIMEELRRNIVEKYTAQQAKNALDNLLQFLTTGQVEIKDVDSYKHLLANAQPFIRDKDVAILAATMLPDVNYLVTRDARDFLENSTLQNSKWAEKILSVEELLSFYR